MPSDTKFERIVNDMALSDAEIVADRRDCVEAIVYRVHERITVELKLKHESYWEFEDGPHSDVVYHFTPISGPTSKAVVDPKGVSNRAHHIWESALNTWPKVLRGSAFLDLVMRSSTETMTGDTFAEVFQKLAKDGD